MSLVKNFHISILGLAILLAVDATLLWGGAFPFLPLNMQTSDVMITFYLLQFIAFWGTMLTWTFCAYYKPSLGRRTLALCNGAPIFLGCSSLLAAQQVPAATMLLVCVGAVLLGAGCAGYYLLFQRFFSSKEPEQGALFIILGTGLSAIIYFILALIPIEVTFYIVSLVLVPFCGFSIIISKHEIDFSQPMFEDTPRSNKRVYLSTLKGYWPSAVCVGCLGFVSGVIRAVVLTDPAVGCILNVMSMLGALFSAVLLLLLWKKASFYLDVVRAYRAVFPFIVTSFILLPFLDVFFLDIFAAAVYMVYSFALAIMMIQCVQAARNMGISPFFICGFFGTVVYFLQSIGFILGSYSDFSDIFGYHQIVLVALGAVWLLAMVMFAVRGAVKDVSSLIQSTPSRVEFLSRAYLDNDARKAPCKKINKTIIRESGCFDQLSKRCSLIKSLYLLSTREAEVMELIARGTTVSRIAELLVISENTVRTHSKRIYSKLAIHKRQELCDLLESVPLTTE